MSHTVFERDCYVVQLSQLQGGANSMHDIKMPSASEVFDLQLVNGVVETNNQAHKPDSGLLRHFGNLAGILATSTRCIETAHFVGCRIWADTCAQTTAAAVTFLVQTQLKSAGFTSSAAVDTQHVCTWSWVVGSRHGQVVNAFSFQTPRCKMAMSSFGRTSYKARSEMCQPAAPAYYH